jgi:hypothetical protein
VPFTLTPLSQPLAQRFGTKPDRHFQMNAIQWQLLTAGSSGRPAAATQRRSVDSQVSDTDRMQSRSHVTMKRKRKLSVCQPLCAAVQQHNTVGVSVRHFVPRVIAGCRCGESAIIAFLGWSAAWIGSYGRFGTTYRIHLQGSSPPRISGLLYPCL